MGYVGRGYTLAGCAGSTVIIDGIRFVQKNDNEYGIYDVINAEGESVVAAASKEDLPKTNDGKIDTNFTEDTTLFGDITVSAKETNANSGYGATGVKVDGSVLDGKGNTLTVTNAGGTWDCVVNTTGGTIKNLTVKGAMRGIFMGGASSDLYIDNVVFQNVIYTFNSDGGNTNYGVYISNCTINGWTSHSDVHKEVVYTNCTFGRANGYAFCRPYGPTKFVGCDFCEGYEIDAIGQIEFTNCTINGVALTVENINTLVSKLANIKLYHDGKYVSLASNTIENQAGVTYTGEWFENPMNDALYFNNLYMTGDATIKVVDKTYGAIILENVSGDINGDVIYIDNDNNSVMILDNCDFTLAEGKKLITSTKTIYQVFMVNITINGEKLTQETAAQYLENVGWYQVVEEM